MMPGIEQLFADETRVREGRPICPNCGKPASFTEHGKYVSGGRGLSYEEDWGMDHEWQEWLTCDVCGAKTDHDEVAQANAPQEASRG
jgi:ribosomal protein S27AE